MPIRTHVFAILLIIAIPLAFFLFDSRFNTITYNCDRKRDFILSTNTPGNTHSAEARLEGSVIRGEVTISGFPDHYPIIPTSPQRYTAGSSISESYANERYGPFEVVFDPSPGAECDLRITYRLASDFSMLNPLW